MIYLDTFENRKKELLNEKLDKIVDHVVYTGETAEVGGNVAFESIEQIGHMVAGASVFKAGSGVFDSYVVLSGITEVVDKGSWQIVGGAASEPDEGKCIFDAFSPDGDVWIMKVNGVMYQTIGAGATIKVKGNIVYTPKTGDGSTFVDGEPEFKPFFTEEQYQALLDLIG